MTNINQSPICDLSESLRPKCILNNVPLADKNWFRTGGPARFFCEPQNMIELQEALNFAKVHDLKVFMLGHGANILISDTGFDGLVIRLGLENINLISHDNSSVLVTAGAGLSMQKLIDWCLENNISGLEEFSGIPGTVGGSVFINIHYFEFLLSEFLVSAHVIDKNTGIVDQVDNNWFNFGYNYSKLHEKNHYLVSATFKLKKINEITAAYCKGKRDEIIRHRLKRYPTTGTCGSFFRNFFDHEVTRESAGKKLIYVAYYLDKIGVKGELSVGDATVSYQHANMLVNRAHATSSDIVKLAQQMQKLVYEKFNILPQPECQLIGFNSDPFLK